MERTKICELILNCYLPAVNMTAFRLQIILL